MANVPLKSITFPGLTDTYTVPQIDANLTASGKAADAKVTGDSFNEFVEVAATPSSNKVHILVSPNSSTIDLATQDEVDEIKSELTLANEIIYDETNMPVYQTSTGWRLNASNGLCSSNSSYKLVKYAVTAGNIIKVVSDDLFQFQSASSVPSSGTSNRVGNTYGTGTFYLSVPNSATYIVFSTPISDSDAVAYLVSSAVDEIKSEIDHLGYNTTYSGTAVDIDNTASAESCEVSSDVSNTVYRTGKNMFWANNNGRTNNGITFAIDSTTKKVTVSGTATGSAWLLANSSSVWFYMPAGTYTLIGGSSKFKLQAQWYDENHTTKSSALVDGTVPVTFTMPVAELCKINGYVASGTSFATPETFEIILAKGSVTEATWEAPSRVSEELAPGTPSTISLVEGLNHLFSTESAEYTYKVSIDSLVGRVDTLETTVDTISDIVEYYDLTGISMTIGCPRTVNDDDSIIYYDADTINYRIGTPEVHQYPYAITFTPASGYRIAFWIKEEGATSYTAGSWQTGSYTVPAGAKWAMEAARQPEVTTQPAVLDVFQKAVITDNPISNVKEKIERLEASDIDLFSVNNKYIDRTDALTQMTALPMFLVFTDIHGFRKYLNRIGEFYETNCTSYCKDALCLGDIVHDKFTDDFTFMSGSEFGKNVLLTIGNHDCYDGTTVGGVPKADVYTKFFANVSLWGVTQPSNASTNGLMYYYKDYDNKIRLIVLDEYYWDSTELSWFTSTLESARTSGLSVIVAHHQGNFTSSEYTPLEDHAFGTDGYDFIRYTSGYTDRRNAVATFIANGGEFVTWLHGHSHCEQSGTFNVNNVPQLQLTFSNAGQDITSRIKIPEYSMDCFYYLAVDTTKKYVYVLTIGQATNKWYKRNLMMAYDYSNHEVVQYY